jgi:hypothetical protein
VLVRGEGEAWGLSPLVRQLGELKARPMVRTFWKGVLGAFHSQLRAGNIQESSLTLLLSGDLDVGHSL